MEPNKRAMELRHLRYFLAVAEAGNFTRAAEALGIAQPPLSQQIQALEAEVGARLFHRVPHGAELTAAGAAFRDEARAAIEASERAKIAALRAERGETGRLKLGFSSSASFNPVVSATLDAFHHAWPNVSVSFEELNTVPLYEKVLRGALDGAFVRPGADDPDGLILKRLADEPMLIALPANHRLAGQARLRLEALAAESFVLTSRESSPNIYDGTVAACRGCGFEPIIGQVTPRIVSNVIFVAAHLGVSIVPACLAQLGLAGVVYREIEGPAPTARLAFATQKRRLAPLLRNFIGLLP